MKLLEAVESPSSFIREEIAACINCMQYSNDMDMGLKTTQAVS